MLIYIGSVVARRIRCVGVIWCSCTDKRRRVSQAGQSRRLPIKRLRYQEIVFIAGDRDPHWTIHCLRRHTK
ncbi:hypothetical protein FWK35_00006626 [Aphis craccivora]|uniref:Uncharacterized protein n=1 Tax=Aphis craccivora TaxID=307492 RepID=A0A6G0ZPY4_APHCR|nr:hypothetical protein FWK35_00006626 [Aphis craccivora]